MASGSGNFPVCCFEKTFAPFTLTSKTPPVPGTSVSDWMPDLNSSSRRAAKLTAFGS